MKELAGCFLVGQFLANLNKNKKSKSQCPFKRNNT